MKEGLIKLVNSIRDKEYPNNSYHLVEKEELNELEVCFSLSLYLHSPAIGNTLLATQCRYFNSDTFNSDNKDSSRRLFISMLITHLDRQPNLTYDKTRSSKSA